jgi:hypothetical protein
VAGALGGTGTVSTVSIAPGGTYSWVNTGSAADRLAATALNLDGAWNVSVSGSPAPGSYTILTTSAGVTNFSAPSVLGASGSVSLAGSNLVLTISALSPFQQWQTNYFGTIANPDAAFDQDPDADGLNNLQEYAFGSVPNLAGSAILPDVGQSGNYLTITVPRNSSATDVSYEVQASTNLLTWSTVQTLSATSPAPAGSTVTYTNATPFSATPHQFLRVNVSLP